MKTKMKATRKSTLIILCGAVLAGGAGWFLTQNYIDQRVVNYKQTFDQERQAIGVVVAAHDLMVGDVISTQTAQIRNIPKVYVPNDAVLPQNFAAALDGRQVKHPIRMGEPILSIHVSSVKIEGLASLLEPGQRAVTIPVDTLDTFSGFLKPGNKVDVYVTVKDGDRDRTAPLIQNLRVLATGEDIDDGIDDKNQKKYSEVTLAVTPLEATKVIHAQTVGDLALLLRKPEDKSSEFDDYVTIDNLVDTKQVSAPPPPPPPPSAPAKKEGFGFELIRGGTRS